MERLAKANLLLVGGSYEKQVFGFELKEGKLKPVFASTYHNGCVKALAAAKSMLVSGSTDESIRIFDINKMVEVGVLHHHGATITCLEFYNDSHLLSGSEDGTIAIWRTKDWESLLVLRGHKKPVNDISIHPSGKMALSVARDGTMRLWNMLTGRCAHTTNLKVVADIVCWSPSGESYCVGADNKVTVYNEEGELVEVLEHPRKVLSVAYLDDETVATGSDDSNLRIWNTKSGECTHTLEGHKNRIRKVIYVKECEILCTASSDQTMKIWDIKQGKGFGKCLASENSGTRITCLAVSTERASGKAAKKDKKRKRANNANDEEDQ